MDTRHQALLQHHRATLHPLCRRVWRIEGDTSKERGIIQLTGRVGEDLAQEAELSLVMDQLKNMQRIFKRVSLR